MSNNIDKMGKVLENEEKRGGAAMVGAPRRRFNLIGTLGFIFAVIGSFAKEQWFPWDRYVFWGLGVVFSFIGLFWKPRGVAILGLVWSFIWFVIMYLVLWSFRLEGR